MRWELLPIYLTWREVVVVVRRRMRRRRRIRRPATRQRKW
jgi:hypothetical protein